MESKTQDKLDNDYTVNKIKDLNSIFAQLLGGLKEEVDQSQKSKIKYRTNR